MTNDNIPHQTSSLYNVKPTSHTSEKRIFPSLPYTSENLKFINKFNFQFSDLTDSEYITLCNMLLKYKTCYATHKNDVGKISTPFRIRLKPNAQLMTQRPSKVPIHYRDKLNALLKELEKYNIIKQIGSSPQDKPVYGTTYLNPLIIIPKGDTIKCVLDARHLNSNTEQSDESWPIEPLAPQLARANKKYKSAIDLMSAYAHTPLDEDTIKLTSFSSGDKLFAFIRGFYGLKGLPNFFTKQMSTFFKTLIEQGFALVYIDDILLLSDSKEHMFQLIEQLHIISTKNNLKLAPEKSFFMLLKVKFLGHEIGYNTIKPIHSKIAAIHKIPSPTGKVALMSFIGALNFYTKFIEKLHINLKPFYDLLHENTPWKWTDEHESLFQKLKMSLTSETELTIPNTKHPFFITVDASLIGLGAVLFQLNEQNKMKVISYNSRILSPQEQKLSTLDRELLGIVHVHRNHLIPYYPKEPLLYPHLRNFMRFSDTTQNQIPQITRYANSDSSPFNSDESLSEEDSQTFMTPPSCSTSNQNTPSITSNDKSLPSSTNDNSLYKHIINTPHTNVPSDRSRHPSHNQTTSLPPLIDRTTKTTYKLRQQPKLDYRLFITPSQL